MSRTPLRRLLVGGAAAGLTLAVLMAGCAAPVPELQMEVSSPWTARVGENAIVRVLLENLPKEGSFIDMAWYGFGAERPPAEGLPVDATFELPSLAGASGDKKRFHLLWESSNGNILGGQMESPGIYSPDGAGSPQDALNSGLEFYFEALAAGTTEITLTMTRADESVIERTVTVVVAE